jgi:two-component system cell cycle response regulator
MFEADIEVIIRKLNIFEKAYDNIRLVDPVQKRVVELYGDKKENTELKCYDFFGTNKVCDNCVSMRAYRENDTFYKMHYTSNDVYMLTAIPIELKDRRVVLELFKKVTNNLIIESNIIGGDIIGNQSDIHSMIDSMNSIALKDSLTGIYNRRYINEKLPLNIVNANIAEKSLSIIMADIDFFKSVNDNYGHLVGDSTLKIFANILFEKLKRESDWVARYGGEKFLICLPRASLPVAVEIAEQMRQKTENSLIESGEQKFHITASFGVCCMTSDMLLSMEELIEMADKKLYDAKHNGRNRVEF